MVNAHINAPIVLKYSIMFGTSKLFFSKLACPKHQIFKDRGNSNYVTQKFEEQGP
jgi:hypothetical protein